MKFDIKTKNNKYQYIGMDDIQKNQNQKLNEIKKTTFNDPQTVQTEINEADLNRLRIGHTKLIHGI